MLKNSNFYEAPVCEYMTAYRKGAICNSVSLDQISDNTDAIEWED